MYFNDFVVSLPITEIEKIRVQEQIDRHEKINFFIGLVFGAGIVAAMIGGL